MRAWTALAGLGLLVVGCTGGALDDPCAAVTCASGRICVAGTCISPDGMQPTPDTTSDQLQPLPDLPPADSEADAADHDLGVDVVVAKDTSLPCPNTATAAGSYSGDFIDGVGGALAKGKVAFKLVATSAVLMTLTGTVNGTALPGIKNYKIVGTLTGLVTCGVVTSQLKGTLDGYAFDGALNGTLSGTKASGLWGGQQSGGGLSFSGLWDATRN